MMIYSRRFDLAYVNPFTFLKTVEASLNDRDNGLLGAHLRWRVANGIEIRGQGLVDDVVASQIGTGFWSNKFAWQLGGMWSAPFGLQDVDIAFEHTRVEPYTYSHFNSQEYFFHERTNFRSGDRTECYELLGTNPLGTVGEIFR